jgi:hypothetical protein
LDDERAGFAGCSAGARAGQNGQHAGDLFLSRRAQAISGVAAEDTTKKARAGVASAKIGYISDVTAYARHSYQDGLSFFWYTTSAPLASRSVTISSISANGGRRSARKKTCLPKPGESRKKEDVAVSSERSYNKVQQTKTMVDVARQVVSLCHEDDRLAANQLTYGVVQVAERRQATAVRYKAQADLLQASLGYLLARAELEQAIGRAPGSETFSAVTH